MVAMSNRGKKGFHIIIVGCGKVGNTLTEQLVREGHDITLIDKDADKVSMTTGLYDVMGVVGNGASLATQIEAGIDDGDLLIAVTDSDELNLLCCTVAKHAAECAAIARVRDPDYSRESAYLQEKLGLAMIINPELESALEVSRILALPKTLEVNAFAHGQAELIKIKVGKESALCDLPLMNIDKKAADTLICAVERDGEVYIPSGSFVIRENDLVSFVVPRRRAKATLSAMGFKSGQVRDCMIIGGGKAAYYLTRQLLDMGVSVKIIERDKKRCEELTVLLPDAVIINGDGTNEDLLREEGIEYAESFVPLTGMDEENILLTLYAKQNSKAKAITKINRIGFKSVMESMDLGSVIYPKYITAEAIIAYVRAKKNSMGSNIETLYHMYDTKVEAIEFRIGVNSPVVNKPLRDLALKKDLLIAFINRNGRILIPSGSDEIHVGDTVMIVTTHSGFNDILDILER